MNIIGKRVLKIMGKKVYKEAEKSANTASVFLHGQTKLPEQVRQLRKCGIEK